MVSDEQGWMWCDGLSWHPEGDTIRGVCFIFGSSTILSHYFCSGLLLNHSFGSKSAQKVQLHLQLGHWFQLWLALVLVQAIILTGPIFIIASAPAIAEAKISAPLGQRLSCSPVRPWLCFWAHLGPWFWLWVLLRLWIQLWPNIELLFPLSSILVCSFFSCLFQGNTWVPAQHWS